MAYYDYHGDKIDINISKKTKKNKEVKTQSKGANARGRALEFAKHVSATKSKNRKRMAGLTPGQSGIVYGATKNVTNKTGKSSVLVRGIDAKSKLMSAKTYSSKKRDPNAVLGKYIDTSKPHLKSGPGVRTTTMTESKSSGYKRKGPRSTTSIGGGAGFMAAVDRMRLHRNSPYRKK